MAGIYSRLEQYDKALVLEKEAAGGNQPSAQSYYGMGVAYLNLNEYDSAYYCLNQALNTSNVYTREAAYQSLSYLSRHCPEYQKYALLYSDSLRFYKDSIESINQSKEIILYKEKYEKEKLKLEQANTTRWLLILIIVCLVLLSVLLYFYQQRKIILHRKEEELNYLTLRLRENELLIERNRRYISETTLRSGSVKMNC